MKVRFQADADLHQVIVTTILRRMPGLDFQTATAAGLYGLPDPQVLARAADEGRLLVSHDQSTMPDHFADFLQHRQSSGLLIIPQHISHALAVEELLLIWVASEAEEWINRISYLPL